MVMFAGGTLLRPTEISLEQPIKESFREFGVIVYLLVKLEMAIDHVL
jgi:hypothetical protein